MKKTILIALGFALSTYLLMSGFAMLEEEEKRENLATQEAKQSS